MMTGNGVMHNGTAIIDDYGLNLDRLKVNLKLPDMQPSASMSMDFRSDRNRS